MSIIKSISGIRGTIGGSTGDNLTPIDIVECTAAYGYWLKPKHDSRKIVIGRDGRISGKMVSALVANTLVGLGFDVIDLGLSTTPTVEMAVPEYEAAAGIILTASHNPKQWNALKLLNHEGEFISAEDGRAFLALLEDGSIAFAAVDELGTYIREKGFIKKHIQAVLDYDLVNVQAVKERQLKVVVDCINSTGAMSIPPLLDALGCEYVLLNAEINGQFAHNPEPLPSNLTEIFDTVVKENADLGIVVDPDVDRLAFVSEDGTFFGEEYTLVAIADYVLSKRKGNTVSNLSSTRALRDVTEKHGGEYHAAAVGEVNVVTKMKEVNAVLGGEGNGGVIVPDFHYGRDALIGIGLFLSHLTASNKKMSELKNDYPHYEMVKDKISLNPNLDLEAILAKLHDKFKEEQCSTIDGLKIDFPDKWVHLRKSNTEPIIRVYSEAATQAEAQKLVADMKAAMKSLL